MGFKSKFGLDYTYDNHIQILDYQQIQKSKVVCLLCAKTRKALITSAFVPREGLWEYNFVISY